MSQTSTGNGAPPSRIFAPILAGANLRDRLIACVGAATGIALAGIASGWATGAATGLLLLGPVGASAVLVFAVPASPLAQPWPVIGGSALSALVGSAAAHLIPVAAIACGVAVAGAVLVMSLLRCLHPPGGAAALLSALAGSAGGSLDLAVPVALNAAALVATGWAFHRLSGHSYPHRPIPLPAPAAQAGLIRADIEDALAAAGEGFDIDRADLEALLRLAERHAARRRG